MIKKYSQLNSGKGYVSLRVKKEDAEKIVKAVKACGVKDSIPAKDMHVTVIYDKSNPEIPVNFSKKLSFQVTPDSLLTLGSGEDQAITLLLKDSSELKEFHNSLLRKGFKHSHFTFSPHISLKYRASAEEIKKMKKSFMLELDVPYITLESPKQESL